MKQRAPLEPAWLPADQAPYGIPVTVRDAGGAELVAIRDGHVGWFDETRAAVLTLVPVSYLGAGTLAES